MESEGNTTSLTLGHADASSSTLTSILESTNTPGYYPNIFDGTPVDTTTTNAQGLGYGMVHITCQADASGYIRAMHSIDNSTWDFIDLIEYPGEDYEIGDARNYRKDIKAKYYKTQFIHLDNSVGAKCNLRLSTVFHPATTPAEKHDIQIINSVNPVDVCLVNTDVSITISPNITISNDPMNVNITQQDLSCVTVSGSVTVQDHSVNIINDPINVNITQQDLGYINVSGIAIPDITVSLSDVTIANEQLNINITQQDLSYVTVSGSVTIPDFDPSPIPQVWESNEIGDTVTAVSTGLTLYTIHCMNFAPDYRFVKLYDLCGTVTIADRPKMTLPVVADVPYSMQFPNGLLFSNSLQVKTTRCLRHDDPNNGEAGDVHFIVTYSV